MSFTLTVNNNKDKNKPVLMCIGVSKRHCLKQLKQAVMEMDPANIDISIEMETKDTRRLVNDDEFPVNFNVEINVNGAGEIESFENLEKGLKRFLEICEEKGDHWDYDQTESLFVEGVREDEIVHQRHPEEHQQTQEAAERVITALDNSGYNRKQVHAIAKWIQYLSTQA